MAKDARSLTVLMAVTAITLVACAAVTVSAHQSDGGDDAGIIYGLNDDMAAGVEDVKGDPLTLTVPEQTEIDGKTYAVTYIACGSMDGCGRLEELYLPSGLEYIEPGTLDRLPSLRSIDVAGGNGSYRSVDGVLFDAGASLLVKYPASRVDADYTLPDSVRDIADMAFCGASDLRTVGLHDNVCSIGDRAFMGCGLVSVTLPGSLSVLGTGVFSGCASLERIDVVPANSNYESADGVLYQAGGYRLVQYPAGNGAADFSVPSEVAEIAEGAFAGCTNLRSITLNECLTDIGTGAFEGCGSLEVVHNDSCLLMVQGSDLYGSVAKYAVVEGNVSTYRADNGLVFNYNSHSMVAQIVDCQEIGTELNIEPSVTIDGREYEVRSIGVIAFIGQPVERIGLPTSISTIAKAAFFGSGLKYFGAMDGLQYIGKSAFACCCSLTKVDLERSIAFIDDYAFGGVSTLTRIDFDIGLMHVGVGAFSGMHFFRGDVEVRPTAETLAGVFWSGTGDGNLYIE